MLAAPLAEPYYGEAPSIAIAAGHRWRVPVTSAYSPVVVLEESAIAAHWSVLACVKFDDGHIKTVLAIASDLAASTTGG